MLSFVKCFIRSGPGAWQCIAPAFIDLPTGHIEVATGCVLREGIKFMNVDLVSLLETKYEEALQLH